MSNRGKQFKALSPKKVSRRKRTPRCNFCGKRDGDDAGGEGQAKVRLKLCARCRRVAYCGMECQKAAWKSHREVCFPFTNAAELPRPSPLVNLQKISASDPRGRRKVTYGGVGARGATPRQRENAPSRHPFFGPQDPIEPERRATVAQSPSTKAVPVRRQKEQEQGTLPGHVRQRSPQREQLANQDDACPSPPTMQRLSFPGGSSLSRHGSKSGSGGNDSKSPSRAHVPRQGIRGGITAAVKMTALRARRKTFTLPNGVRSLGSLSPPPPPFGQAVSRSPPSGPIRRESAPLYPVALEKTRRRATDVDPRQRGPPPPYASVTHLTRSKKMLPSTSPKEARASGASVTNIASLTSRSVQNAAEPTIVLEPPRGSPSSAGFSPTKRTPPPLPPRNSLSLGDTMLLPPRSPLTGLADGTSTISPQLVPEKQGGEGDQWVGDDESMAAKHVGAGQWSELEKERPLRLVGKAGQGVVDIDSLVMPKEREDGKQRTCKGEEGDTDELTPELRDGDPQTQRAQEASRWVLPPSLAEGCAQDAPASSPRAQEDKVFPVQQASTKAMSRDFLPSCAEGQEDKAAPASPFFAKDSTDSMSQDSAAGSVTGQEKEVVPVRPSPTNGSVGALSQDSAAAYASGEPGSITVSVRPSLAPCSADPLSEGSAAESPAAQEDNALPVPLPTEPPQPILPLSATSTTAASDFARAADSGVFDSCPTSTTSKSGSHRSLSVDTMAHFRSMPLTVAAKGVRTEAAAAWNKDRRNSPRPRPPVSPGPAALSQSSPTKVSSRFRKQSAAEPDDNGRKKLPSVSMRGGKLSERSLYSGSRGASPRSGIASPRISPFVPAIEMSPQRELCKSPHTPGPRPTDTANFYEERSGVRVGDAGLPPASRTYLGRPKGFSVHVLVASSLSAADLASRTNGSSGTAGGGVENQHLAGRRGSNPWLYYSFEDRGRVAAALRPGDVVLVTPGRYESRKWGLEQLISSVEIIGAGNAGDCVLYNNPAPSVSGPTGEHYLIGVMGGALGSAGVDGASVPEVSGKDDVEDDSDSGFEDGALGIKGNSVGPFCRRAVRVRLANLTLEQGSGYRGAVYQLGRESHLEMDGCTVLCSQGGINVDQGTCVICDSSILGSESFGVHIGQEGTMEHCSIRSCGKGGRSPEAREGGKAPPSTVSSAEEDDDGTEVNGVRGMPAISVLQGSRVRVRFNVIRGNAGHALQYRDAPLPGGGGKHAMLARRAEAEAEEMLRSWLGSAAVLLREHLQTQHREGSIVFEGNACHLNRGCEMADCPSISGIPTAEEEGLPLPAAMTLRFLAAMDEGYVGSRREENARSKRRKEQDRAGS